MENRKNVQHYKIFDYWKDKAITKDGDIVDVNDEKYFNSSIEVVCDWGEPECFACRKIVDSVLSDENYENWLNDDNGLEKIWNHKETKKHLQKAHIIPHSLDGGCVPSNLFLLCKHCHEESPDTNNPQNFFRYIYMKRNSPNKSIKRYFMFIEECITRNLDATTFNIDLMINNTSFHGGRLSDYTWAMGMADTCKKSNNKMTDSFQINMLEKMKKLYQYNI